MVRVWAVSKGKSLLALRGHSAFVTSVSFSPDGRLIASGSADKTIKLWDADSGKELQTLKGHKSEVCCIAFTPDGERLVSGSDDNTIMIWDISGVAAD